MKKVVCIEYRASVERTAYWSLQPSSNVSETIVGSATRG
jgi:hypothetical protein